MDKLALYSIINWLLQAIPGVYELRDKQNPAAWILEASSVASEVRLGIDFAECYKSSAFYK